MQCFFFFFFLANRRTLTNFRRRNDNTSCLAHPPREPCVNANEERGSFLSNTYSKLRSFCTFYSVLWCTFTHWNWANQGFFFFQFSREMGQSSDLKVKTSLTRGLGAKAASSLKTRQASERQPG